MAKLVNCVKLGIEAEGLDEVPFPGAKGLEIFENVSKQAWKEWLGKQTMIGLWLPLERRLDPTVRKACVNALANRLKY